MSSSLDVDGKPQRTQVLASIVVILVTYHFILRPALFSPLARIPNAHWSAPYSRLWILYTRYNNRENRTRWAAHKRLGPVIRLAPYELSVDDVDCVRTVYQGGFDKSTWYSIFDNYGVPCMFSTRAGKEHSLRKRWISHVYSKSYIHSSAAASSQAHSIIFSRLLPLVQSSTATSSSSPPQAVDVHSLFLAATMDFISSYVFGLATSTNFLQSASYREHWLGLYKSRNDHGFYDQELPRLTAICRKLGIPLCPRHVDDANAELGTWCMRLVKRAGEALRRRVGDDNAAAAADEPTVMAALLAGIRRGKEEEEAAADGPESPLYRTAVLPGETAVASELFDHVLAGQETAGVTLTYLSWRLSLDAGLQRKLREELLTLGPGLKHVPGGRSVIPDAKELDALPLLHAVVMETLRLHAPIPGPQPRVTPEGGCELAGYNVPGGGVRVAALAYTLHRDEGVFPKPLDWDHTRWLPGNAVTEREMRERKKAFWAFSSGGRMCIGSNFAMHEMKLIIAAVYSNYTTHVVNDEGLDEQTDGYTSRPAKERLLLSFERVSWSEGEKSTADKGRSSCMGFGMQDVARTGSTTDRNGA